MILKRHIYTNDKMFFFKLVIEIYQRLQCLHRKISLGFFDITKIFFFCITISNANHYHAFSVQPLKWTPKDQRCSKMNSIKTIVKRILFSGKAVKIKLTRSELYYKKIYRNEENEVAKIKLHRNETMQITILNYYYLPSG